jgi:alanyl-tRNA synthetase
MGHFAPQLGGKGGGRADFAQGGGDKPDMVDQVLKQVPEWIQEQLA